MASKFTELMNDADLPPAVIAQAEAAVLGNIEEDSAMSRQPTNDPSQYLHPLSPSTTAQSNSSFVYFIPKHTAPANNAQTPRRSQAESSHQAPNTLEDETTSPPPAYGQRHDELELSQDGFDTQAKVTGEQISNIQYFRCVKFLLIFV